MKIAIDVTPLETGHKHRGVGVYTKLLIESLEKYEKSVSYTLFTRGKKIPKHVDLVHYPYFDPFFHTLPLAKQVATVVTVHDLIPIDFPFQFPRGLKGGAMWQVQRLSLRGARRIITDSEASKGSIHTQVGVPKNRIDVVYLAAQDVYTKPVSASRVTRIKKAFGLPDTYFLYVGDVNWNKNILGLIDAYASLPDRVRTRVPLVLVGKAFLNETIPETQRILERIQAYGIDASVKRLGFVSDKDLPVLYAHATAYVQPSFAEGFGLPVLEAMRSGCLAIVSTQTSLSEIAGPSITIDPYDKNALARAMQSVLSMRSSKRAALADASVQWAQTFSWKRVARETVASYEQATSNR